ncbi:aminodeoxychorismate/anthranilate synthase component II [bacterium]|nr:aminodeoxychorismate/anthranilate synthase component II [bacterium]
MILILDNYDSFTYNLNDYFLQQGVKTEVIRNDKIKLDSLGKYSGIVISPGPGLPQEAGLCMDLLNQEAGNIPIFGVCLGMQAIGIQCGASLKKAKYPMHGKVSELNFDAKHVMFQDIEVPLEVCRYHSLIIEMDDSSPLEAIAITSENEVMAVAHTELPLWGVQFHPESILSTQGMQIIKNWLKHFNLQ